MPTDSLNIKIIVRPTAIASIVRPRPVFKGGGLENFGSETKGGGGWKKILKRAGLNTKGDTSFKRGAGKFKVRSS